MEGGEREKWKWKVRFTPWANFDWFRERCKIYEQIDYNLTNLLCRLCSILKFCVVLVDYEHALIIAD